MAAAACAAPRGARVRQLLGLALSLVLAAAATPADAGSDAEGYYNRTLTITGMRLSAITFQDATAMVPLRNLCACAAGDRRSREGKRGKRAQRGGGRHVSGQIVGAGSKGDRRARAATPRGAARMLRIRWKSKEKPSPSTSSPVRSLFPARLP